MFYSIFYSSATLPNKHLSVHNDPCSSSIILELFHMCHILHHMTSAMADEDALDEDSIGLSANSWEVVAKFSKTCPWKDSCTCGGPPSLASSSHSLEPAMHDAYDAAPILEKLPLQIESLACYGK